MILEIMGAILGMAVATACYGSRKSMKSALPIYNLRHL